MLTSDNSVENSARKVVEEDVTFTRYVASLKSLKVLLYLSIIIYGFFLLAFSVLSDLWIKLDFVRLISRETMSSYSQMHYLIRPSFFIAITFSYLSIKEVNFLLKTEKHQPLKLSQFLIVTMICAILVLNLITWIIAAILIYNFYKMRTRYKQT